MEPARPGDTCGDHDGEGLLSREDRDQGGGLDFRACVLPQVPAKGGCTVSAHQDGVCRRAHRMAVPDDGLGIFAIQGAASGALEAKKPL